MNLYSQALEEKILAHLIVCPAHYERAALYLKPEHFYFPQHQKIYEAMIKINQEGGVADLVALHHAMRKNPDYDPYLLTELTRKHTYIANIEEKSLILIQHHFSRQIKKVGKELMEKAGTEDGLELLEYGFKEFENLYSTITNHKETDFKKIAIEAQQEIKVTKETGISGIKTYFNEIDDITRGRHKGELVLIAGRPSHGKTTLTLCEAYQVAQDRPVAIFSLEMPGVQLMKKIISRVTQITLDRLQTGSTDIAQDEQIDSSVKELFNYNQRIFLYDITSIHIRDLSNIVRKLRRTKGIEVVYIDYIQLMSGFKEKGSNRDQEIGTISRGLKKLAMDLNICVVALSQLNREVETRADKRPQLSDLRESGNLEQDADIVQTIFCPEKYGIEEIKIHGVVRSTHNIAEIVIHKNRNGKIGVAHLNFNRATSTLTNWEEPFQ